MRKVKKKTIFDKLKEKISTINFKKNNTRNRTRNTKSKESLEKVKGKQVVKKKGNTYKSKTNTKKKTITKPKRSIWKKILTIILIIGIVGVLLMTLFFGYIALSAPKFSEKAFDVKDQTVVYDVNGEIIATLGAQKRESVSYDELPQVLIDAIIATEDSRFFQHNGVDLPRFIKATILQLLGRDAGGASTLTMQAVKNNLTKKDTLEKNKIQKIIRKFQDVYLAVFKVEKEYSKEEIIELYVNNYNLGANIYGVQEASKYYFGKNVSELTLPEASLIAGLFQAPNAYDPYLHPEKAEARRNIVLNLMYKHGYITEEQRDIAKSIPVTTLLSKTNSSLNKYIGYIDTVVDEVEKRTGDNPYLVSMNIYSTLDPEKQDIIEDINNGVTYKWYNDVAQAGIAVIDVKTGAIVAVGAGRNKTTERSWNYATMIKRHPGSTAKPIFDYGPAIEYLNWSSGQTVVDDTYTYSGGGKIKNWDNGFKGVMTAREALASSRNIPALYTFQQVEQKDIKEFVTNLGITPEYEGNTIVESHSIGGFNGTSPVDLAAAYAAFARGGTYIEPYSFTKIEYVKTNETYTVKPKKVKAMEESTAYIINKMLQRSVTGNYISTTVPSGTDVAGKSGTSTIDEAKIKALGIKKSVIGDVWQVTYTPDYAISLWYGYKDLTKENYLTNTEGGPARRNITKLLTKGIFKPNSKWEQPSSVVTAKIELGSDPLVLASEFTPSGLVSEEYFKKGTQPTEVSTRFSQLENPTNLKYSAGTDSVTLTWDPIKTPDAINEEYLTKYFSSNVYKHWGNKYLNQRLAYNANNIGTLGYSIYIETPSGLQYLANTTNTSYTYTGYIDTSAKFVIKSQYSIFTANQSSGAEINVVANTSGGNSNTTPTNPTTTTPSSEWKVSNKLSNCISHNTYKYQDINQVSLIENGQQVTSNYQVKDTCTEQTTNTVMSCDALDPSLNYTLTRKVIYKNNSKDISTITISNSCP